MSTKKEEFLIYVNKLSYDYRGRGVYEFIFTDDLDQEIGDTSWMEKPASSSTVINCPDISCITSVGTLKLEAFDFIVVQESDYFSVAEGQEGIVALAFEEEQPEDENDDRIILHYGESKKNVIQKLFSRDLNLKFD